MQQRPVSQRLAAIAVAAVLFAFWWIALGPLHREWTANPQYRYGWAVPFLALYLLFERWRTRPEPAPRASDRRWILAGTAVLVGMALPMRLVFEAFPGWRPLSWGLALLALGFSALAWCWLGGPRWSRHFLFPGLFALTAVPWPTPVENAVLQGLMRFNATLAADLLTLFGHPAVQRGNLIEIGSGFVGVDEACSGMRSMQAALMISLVMGELFAFGWARRTLMVAAGLAMAFATNLLRSLYLVWLAASRGVDAIAGVHDQAGLLTMAVCVAGLWALGLVLRPRSRDGAGDRGGAAPAPAPSVSPARAFPIGWAIALGAALAGGEIATETWYRLRSADHAPAATWGIEWPETSEQFTPIPIRDTVRAILRIDDGDAAGWRSPRGTIWVVHHLRWEPQPAAYAILARYHTPEVCLPAGGTLLRQNRGPAPVTVAAVHLPFHAYVFEEHGRAIFVYYLLQEDRSHGTHGAGAAGAPLWRERLRLVWEGKRTTGQTALHVVLRGPETAAEADAELVATLARLIRPVPHRTTAETPGVSLRPGASRAAPFAAAGGR
jgi:exosortase